MANYTHQIVTENFGDYSYRTVTKFQWHVYDTNIFSVNLVIKESSDWTYHRNLVKKFQIKAKKNGGDALSPFHQALN